ncbi:MAG: SixA phosphatase family protein [Chitinophagaceae bacterium]
MKNYLLFFSLTLLLTACSHTSYYIVRHAEKASANGNDAMMGKDPPLTEAGKLRAEALKEMVKTKKIGYVFSTNTIRTRSTAEPVRAYFNLVTETYSPMPDSSFISRIKSLKKNTLIVGHSNTVDDIVNKLCGSIKITADLGDTEYNNLYIVTRKGRKMNFVRKDLLGETKKYGTPSK